MERKREEGRVLRGKKRKWRERGRKEGRGGERKAEGDGAKEGGGKGAEGKEIKGEGGNEGGVPTGSLKRIPAGRQDGF